MCLGGETGLRQGAASRNPGEASDCSQHVERAAGKPLWWRREKRRLQSQRKQRVKRGFAPCRGRGKVTYLAMRTEDLPRLEGGLVQVT